MNETYHIIQMMKATGNRPGLIQSWKELVAEWAQTHPTDPHATAVKAWLPFWQPRPFYTAEELAPLWPALAIVTGATSRWPAVPKSARRLENDLDFHGLPRLPEPWREYFICERIQFWVNSPHERIAGRLKMTTEEQSLYEKIVHGLRSQGWSRIEAEDEALNRIEKLRENKNAQR